MFLWKVTLVIIVCGIAMAECCVDKIPKCPKYLFCFFPFFEQNCRKSCNLCHLSTKPPPPTTTPPPLSWNTWTTCSKPCGNGTRYRVPRCPLQDISRCDKVYQDCNEQKCNPKTCPRNEEHRYKDNSKCCKPSTSQCGRVTKGAAVVGRVLGGTPANPSDWPWMTRLIIQQASGLSSICGGSILSKRWIVTAGHCLAGIDKSKVKAYVGYGTNKQKLLALEKIEFHPEYAFPQIDIVLIKVTKPIDFNENVGPICLPQKEDTADDKICHVIGFGSVTRTPGPPSPTLQQAKLRKLPFNICKQAYANRPFGNAINESITMCAGRIAGGVDTCLGDSGGPFMCQRCSSCSWYLSGIISSGPLFCATPGLPGMNTNVIHYEDWITKVVPGLDSKVFSCK